MQPLSPSHIAEAVRAVTADYLEEEPGGILAINCGRCEDLALEVIERLGRTEGDGIETLEAGSLGEGFEGPLDLGLMARQFPASQPPAPLGWEELDALGVTEVRHIWLVSDGRHYDADVPDGVDSLFDLPVMRRNLAAEVRHSRQDMIPELRRHAWWAETFAMHDEFLEWRAAESQSSPGPA